MTVRDRLRSRLDVGDSKGPNDPRDSDEEILNVFRRELQKLDGDEWLTTTEVSEELSIGSDQTGNRLDTLEDEGRVERRRAGQTDMWKLDDQEPKEVMNPKLGTVVKASTEFRRSGDFLWNLGKTLGAIALAIMIIALTISMTNVRIPLSDWTVVLALGYLFGLFASGLFGSAAVLDIFGKYFPDIVERILLA